MADGRRASFVPDNGHNKQPKTEKSRRLWSVREEDNLRLSLKELVALGWKSDNGFRGGYLNKLEESLQREFANTDLKIHPHIVSKLTAWKKNYYSLQGILGRSGVGFNNKGDYMIDCDDDQWEQIVKVDANARLMRNKPWPFWEDWKIIFGKDRANGTDAEDILEAVDELNTQENNQNVHEVGDYNVGLDEVIGIMLANDGVELSVPQGEKDNKAVKCGGKKRKSDGSMDAIFELMSKMHNDTNARLEGLSNRIGYEVDLSKARKDVYAILGRLPGLSIEEKFEVSETLVGKPDRLDLFMGLSDSDRPAYVSWTLKSNRKSKK